MTWFLISDQDALGRTLLKQTFLLYYQLDGRLDIQKVTFVSVFIR